jgi:hypothetical protein
MFHIISLTYAVCPIFGWLNTRPRWHKHHACGASLPRSSKEKAVVLDQLLIRAFADKGDDWNAFVADAVTEAPRRFRKAVLIILRPVAARLRRAPSLSLPTLVPMIFLGIAALPAALALGLTA